MDRTVTCMATDSSNHSRACAFRLTVLTTQAATQQLSNDINGLVSQGVLNQGNGNALSSKLRAAIGSMNAGNATAACNQLQAFINQAQAFMNDGKLTPTQAGALIDSAAALKHVLGC